MPTEEKALRVLLVEDDPDDVLLVRATLGDVTSHKFDLTVAGHLREALALVSERPFDAALVDLSLPDSLGLETFQKVHDQAPELPTVVLTGIDDEQMALNAVQAGAQDYLFKGQMTGSLLVRAIRYAIERQRTLRYRDLLVQRERFDTAVAQMTDGIIVTDETGHIGSANRAARLFLNLPDEGWRGTPLVEALRPFTLSPTQADLLSSRDRVTAFEIAREQTSPPLFLGARLTRLFDAGGEFLSAVLILRDITDERCARHVQASFFLMVSHKLRTPLSVMMGYAHLYRMMSPEKAQEQLPGVMEVFEEELQRLGETVERLLDFKALSTQQLAEQTEQTSLARTAADVAESLRARYPTRRLEVEVTVPPEAGKTEAAERDLTLVLGNLMGNAVKFADKDPIRIRVASASDKPGWVRVTVQDNGPGIPHEYYDRIFQGFVQIEERVTGQVEGLGVGLYLTRRVVEAYGGAMTVRSVIGEGTTFSFTLPATEPIPMDAFS
jgi:signal transduction histidine kinase